MNRASICRHRDRHFARWTNSYARLVDRRWVLVLLAAVQGWCPPPASAHEPPTSAGGPSTGVARAVDDSSASVRVGEKVAGVIVHDNVPRADVIFETDDDGREVRYAVGGPWGRKSIDPDVYFNRTIETVGAGVEFPDRIAFDWKWTDDVEVPGVCLNPDHHIDGRHVSVDDDHTRAGRVKAFNYIGIGRLNQTEKYYGDLLPRALGDIATTATLDCTSRWERRDGNYNFSINMMVIRDGQYTHELHVFETYGMDIPPPSREEFRFVHTDRFGDRYLLRKVRNAERHYDPRGNPYYQAWRIERRDGGRVDLGGLLNAWRAADRKNASDPNFRRPERWEPLRSEDQLSFIRAGFEVKHGTGEARLTKFDGERWNDASTSERGLPDGF